MANPRMIRSNFFNDPLITEKYEEDQRYLLIGLACAADDYGRFWWKSKNLKSIIYPLDSRQPKWIEKNLELFYKDEILCKYQVKNITYGHFPLWFDKSFFLKQRLDHPKPVQLPDCKIHQMNEKNTRTLRETSHTSKPNVTESNGTQVSVSDNTTLTISDSLFKEMSVKYPAKDITKDKLSFLNYPYHQNNEWSEFEVAERFSNWCANQKLSHEMLLEQFKRDSCGFPMGYCKDCGVSASYKETEIYGESRCCNSKILPSKRPV